ARPIRSLNWSIVRHRAEAQRGRPHDDEGRPLIPPGGLYTYTQEGDGSGKLEARGFAVDTPTEARVDAVTFTDGDYEGDPKLALPHIARSAAQRIFLQRLIFLLSDNLATETTDVRSLGLRVDQMISPPNRDEQDAAVEHFSRLREMKPIDRLDAYNLNFLLM